MLSALGLCNRSSLLFGDMFEAAEREDPALLFGGAGGNCGGGEGVLLLNLGDCCLWIDELESEEGD